MKILLNRSFNIFFICYIVITTSAMAFCAALAFGCFPEYAQPCIPAAIACIVMGLGTPIVVVIEPHRTGFVWLNLSEHGIEYCALFRRKKVRSYSEYPYWSRGRYLHIAVVVEFIVISKRKLNTRELYQINQVMPSADLIKIRYTKKTYQKLMKILPKEQQLQLQKIFPVTAP